MKFLLQALREQLVPILCILLAGVAVIGYCIVIEIVSWGGPMDLP